MGFFKDLFDTASRHNSRKNEGSAVYVCPKCGCKKRIDDYKWKEECAPEQLAKEATCPDCGTKMVRKTLFN